MPASFAIYGASLSIVGTARLEDGVWQVAFRVLDATRTPVFDSSAPSRQ